MKLDSLQYKKGNTAFTLLIIILLIVAIIIVYFSLAYFKNRPISLSDTQVSSGAEVNVKENQKVEFVLNNEKHTITTESIQEDGVDLIIESERIKVHLNIGEEKKFDLNNDGIYDLKIKLNGINNGKADLIIIEISEQICKENWSCESWSLCLDGTQTHVCTDVNSCGTEENKPPLSQTCITCTENWQCESWSSCSNDQQTRTCTDLNNCETEENKPKTSQSCVSGGVNETKDFCGDGICQPIETTDNCLEDCPLGIGTLGVHVFNSINTSQNIQGALIEIFREGVLIKSANSDESGSHTFTLSEGEYNITASAEGYKTSSLITTLDLISAPNGLIQGIPLYPSQPEIIVNCTDKGGIEYNELDEVSFTVIVNGIPTVTSTVSDFCLKPIVDLANNYTIAQTILDNIINEAYLTQSQVNDPNILMEAYCPEDATGDSSFEFSTPYSCPNACVLGDNEVGKCS